MSDLEFHYTFWEGGSTDEVVAAAVRQAADETDGMPQYGTGYISGSESCDLVIDGGTPTLREFNVRLIRYLQARIPHDTWHVAIKKTD
ncbi:MAG: hypothetical protein O3C28_18495 [Proteobacteria bacterium]|nr:hypothetical protein [Pseudomonadota bacterium]